MPIYEYRCQDCQTRFEKLLLRSADAAELACPNCGRKRLTQELSVFAAHSAASRPAASACPSAAACPNAGVCGMN
ncbi:MAG: zinc ribbon domain-containing protein [Acidobacteria bacterium]|nr:zinc ribbon domain-containing protein [Acidobacteriota bacterium]